MTNSLPRARSPCAPVGAAWLTLALFACAGASSPIAPPTPDSAIRRASPASAALSVRAPAPEPGAVDRALPADSSKPSAPAAAALEAPFPPAAFSAPQPKSAQPGDGTWTQVPEAGELGQGVLVRTTVHPHPYNKFVFVSVLAIDLRKVELRLAAGTRDPPSSTIAADKRTGLVPLTDQGRLLAVFNGGFQAKHGKHGMMVDGDVFLPAQDNACSVLIRRDGKVAIGTWSELKSQEADAIAWRQSPPCLVEKGEVNPVARSGDGSRKFGMAIDGKMTIRRTALGTDATGERLLFGFGEDVTPALFAEAMRAAGAVASAQFDINWSYTKFFFYAHLQGKPPTISSSLVPRIKFAKGGYVSEPAPRDFFYLKRKPDE